VIAAFAWGRASSWPVFPRWGRFYPVSRAELARVTFWSSLLQNAGHCAVTGLIFAAGGLAAAALAGGAVTPDGMPAFARALGLVFVVLPVQQWLRLRQARQMEAGGFRAATLLTIMLSFAFAVLVTLWTIGYPRPLRGSPRSWKR